MNAAALVRCEFSLDLTVARYAEAYEELLGRRSHPGPCPVDGEERRQSSLEALQ